ncbi:photosystem II oxygen-evolving enhancer protein 3 [Marchantia polymorpha subsp. ruderalis]|uniref:Uncharacterized protein n=2 Tax=Marchantia polymorpha TaxID=3197 RepID=A0A176WFB3_MARPO|nr:hypothetical protein AXG93_2294s1090 [Marchantia polymorpha subsp. ruderalis]PTQ31109.1 hypothetical protein MARPO_0115s0030 [Marchantia polymorpha]BBN07945.1 hypothetical protein Mp_4g07510 [Marchantia polymorpha subsp. ruderalis]CCI55393.1 PSII subunit PsbQ [Marchantia polymorpha]|eukprot:PTQ31109.1 hypothetical protein MARPO_0115s0030 [Marchantia polymorpha]
MAQTVCMAGISGVKLEGLAAQGAVNSRVLNGTASSVCVRSGRMNVVALSSQDETSSRRSLLGLIATSVAAGVFVSDAHAVSTIKLNPPPPPSGGLGGTKNADQARDTDLPLKDRFFIQKISDGEALERLKVAAKAVSATKADIERKAWPYVQNGLRGEAQTLFPDMDQLIASKKTREERKALIGLKTSIKDALDGLDYACRTKNLANAQKYYDQAVSGISEIIPKLG